MPEKESRLDRASDVVVVLLVVVFALALLSVVWRGRNDDVTLTLLVTSAILALASKLLRLVRSGSSDGPSTARTADPLGDDGDVAR